MALLVANLGNGVRLMNESTSNCLFQTCEICRVSGSPRAETFPTSSKEEAWSVYELNPPSCVINLQESATCVSDSLPVLPNYLRGFWFPKTHGS